MVSYYKYLFFSLLISGGMCSAVEAQITTDGTTNTTLETTNGGITIEDGDRAGNNLFHSFSEFSVPDGSSATFNNPVEIENIFSRVTGGDISNINGAINANGGANLLLINPAGIVFGENASLNLGGSFLATTADTLLFEEGEFSAVNPQAAPILTIDRPIGLNFGENAGDIVNRANSGQSRTATFTNGDRVEEVTINTPIGLEVDPGESITLVGGDISIDGGGVTAPSGRVELGGLSAAGEVTIDADDRLSFPDGVAKANLNLSDDAEVDVSGDGRGAIAINVNNLVLLEGSELFAGIAEGAESGNVPAGDITINTDESVRLIGNGIDIEGLDTVISNHVGLSAIKREDADADSSAVGDSGSIFINTDRLELSDRAVISTITFGEGNVGKIVVEANTVEMNTLGEIASRVRQGRGNSNNVELDVNSLNLNDAFIVSDVGNFRQDSARPSIGDGGSVIINARDTIAMDSANAAAVIISQIQRDAIGDAGNIEINTGTLSLGKVSLILSTNAAEGSSGNIDINATESIELNGDSSLILSQLLPGVVGNGGDINITAPNISLTNFSKIAASALAGSEGEAGAITIAAEDRISISGGSVIDALSENNFDSGDVDLQTDTLELGTGGKIVAGSDGDGNAGNINLSIGDNIVVDNGNPPEGSPFNEPYLRAIEFETGVFANSSFTSTGSGGSIFITADSIELVDRGTFSTSTFSGNGGNIDLQIADTLSLRDNSTISAEASGIGSGGNVNIDSDLIIAFRNSDGDGSDIVAKAAETGTGGNIEISADAILGLQARNATPFNNTNDIDASSEFGLDGSVAINNPDVDPTAGIVELPTVPIDAEAILAQDLCKVENEDIAGGSSFIVTGKGGLSPTSAESLDNRDRVVNWAHQSDVRVSSGVISVPNPQRAKRRVVQSQGIAVAPDGSIWLTAKANNIAPQNSQSHPDCQT